MTPLVRFFDQWIDFNFCSEKIYIQLGKSLALTIGPEKELLFLGSVNYSVDEVLILPDRS